MYRKKGRSWTKHIDFMLLDVLCMQIAFIVSYICRLGLNNPYIDKDYRILAVAFLLIDFFVEIVSDAFKNVLKRGYLDEFIVTCKHVALVEIITTFFLFTTQMGEIYSRMSYYIIMGGRGAYPTVCGERISLRNGRHIPGDGNSCSQRHHQKQGHGRQF